MELTTHNSKHLLVHNSSWLRVTNRVHMDCSERTTVLKERQRCAWMTAIDLLSCNTGLFWPDLEHASTNAHTHTQAGSQGIKSRCVRSQSTERRIKELRDVIWLIWGVLQAFGGTGFTARGDWHCWSVSHMRADHSRGEQSSHTMKYGHTTYEIHKTAHLYRSWILIPSNKYKCCAYRKTSLCKLYILVSFESIVENEKMSFLWKCILSCIYVKVLHQNLFLPLKEQVQRSAPSRMGLHACWSGYTLQRSTAIHSQRWEQRGPRIGPHCHSAIISTAREWIAHFFYYNRAFFPFCQQRFWRIWSLPLNLSNGFKHS